MLKVDNFNVRVVFNGEGYGVNDCIIHDKDDALVEFYDSTYTKGSVRGQFVSRYYASTLLQGQSHGLCLDGGVPEWTVSAEDMKTVREYIKAVL